MFSKKINATLVLIMCVCMILLAKLGDGSKIYQQQYIQQQ